MPFWRQSLQTLIPGERRLRLGGLDPLTRMLATAGLVVLLLASSLILLTGFGWEIPGGSDLVLGGEGVPRMATLLAYGGIGVGAAGAVIALQGLPPALEWPLRGMVALVIASLAGILADAARLLVPSSIWALPQGLDDALRIGGWVAFTCALVVAATPPAWARRLPAALAAITALPFAIALGLYLIPEDVPSSLLETTSHGSVALGILSLVATLGLATSALFLWQAVAGVRATQATAVRFSRRFGAASLRWLLWLLAIKLAWLGLGYAGLLPAFLGGDSAAWDNSRHDGLLSWVLAAGFAAAAIFALERYPMERIDVRGLRPAMIWVTIAFTGFVGLSSVALLLWGALGVFDAEGLRSGLQDAIEWLADGLLWSTVITVFAAVALAGLLLAMRRRWAGLAFLVVLVIWALPRALQATPGLGDEHPFRGLGVDVLTFDALLTVALFAVAIARRRLAPAEIILVLVASTLIANTAVVLGAWDSTTYFYVALVLPAAFLFLYDADDLNREGPHRRSRVLGTVSLSATVLTIVAVQAILGQVGPDQESQGELVRLVMAVPLAGVLIGASLAASRAGGEASARGLAN